MDVSTLECNKFDDDKRKSSQEISSFIEFLSESGITLCQFDERTQQYEASHVGDLAKSRLIAEYLGLDHDKMEQERQQILEALRKEP